MSVIHWLGLFLGSVTAPWSQWWNRGTGPARMPMGTPPMDYTQKTQPELLASFSDAIGPDGITPRSLRDFVASTATTTPGGSPPTIPLLLPGWTTATRPNGANLAGPAIGFNYDLQQLDMWDNQLGIWVNPSFQGGVVAGATTFVSGVNFDSAIAVAGVVSLGSTVIAPNLGSGCLGVASGTFWNNGQTVSICP